MGSEYETVLRELVSPFVTYPDHIRTSSHDVQGVLNVTLQVHRTDIPYVMGKGASTVRSLTTLVKAIAERKGDKVWFEVLEPTTGVSEPKLPFEEKPGWGREDDERVFRVAMSLVRNLHTDAGATVYSEDNRTNVYLKFPVEPKPHVVSAIQVLFRSIGKGMGRKTISVILNDTSSQNPKGQVHQRA